MNVKRNDLIRQLADKYGYTKKAATSIIDDFSNVIIDNLRNGDSVTIYNFGCFDILERKARSCPNPRTGEKVDIPAHWIPRFYPGNGMRMAVKLWEDSSKRGLQ